MLRLCLICLFCTDWKTPHIIWLVSCCTCQTVHQTRRDVLCVFMASTLSSHCVVCIITSIRVAWPSDLHAYFLVTQRLCSPVVLSLRRCCLDKQAGREVADNRFGSASGPLTVTLIATLQEQQGRQENMITAFWMSFLCWLLLMWPKLLWKWDFGSSLCLNRLGRFSLSVPVRVGGPDEMTGHPLLHTLVIWSTLQWTILSARLLFIRSDARSHWGNRYFRQTATRLAKGVGCTLIKIPFTPHPPPAPNHPAPKLTPCQRATKRMGMAAADLFHTEPS